MAQNYPERRNAAANMCLNMNIAAWWHQQQLDANTRAHQQSMWVVLDDDDDIRTSAYICRHDNCASAAVCECWRRACGERAKAFQLFYLPWPICASYTCVVRNAICTASARVNIPQKQPDRDQQVHTRWSRACSTRVELDNVFFLHTVPCFTQVMPDQQTQYPPHYLQRDSVSSVQKGWAAFLNDARSNKTWPIFGWTCVSRVLKLSLWRGRTVIPNGCCWWALLSHWRLIEYVIVSGFRLWIKTICLPAQFILRYKHV